MRFMKSSRHSSEQDSSGRSGPTGSRRGSRAVTGLVALTASSLMLSGLTSAPAEAAVIVSNVDRANYNTQVWKETFPTAGMDAIVKSAFRRDKYSSNYSCTGKVLVTVNFSGARTAAEEDRADEALRQILAGNGLRPANNYVRLSKPQAGTYLLNARGGFESFIDDPYCPNFIPYPGHYRTALARKAVDDQTTLEWLGGYATVTSVFVVIGATLAAAVVSDDYSALQKAGVAGSLGCISGALGQAFLQLKNDANGDWYAAGKKIGGACLVDGTAAAVTSILDTWRSDYRLKKAFSMAQQSGVLSAATPDNDADIWNNELEYLEMGLMYGIHHHTD